MALTFLQDSIHIAPPDSADPQVGPFNASKHVHASRDWTGASAWEHCMVQGSSDTGAGPPVPWFVMSANGGGPAPLPLISANMSTVSPFFVRMSSRDPCMPLPSKMRR